MIKQRPQYILIAAITGALALSACGKNEDHPSTAPTTAPPPPVAPAPAAPAPAPAPAPVAVASVDLGSAVGPDQKITAPTRITRMLAPGIESSTD